MGGSISKGLEYFSKCHKMGWQRCRKMVQNGLKRQFLGKMLKKRPLGKNHKMGGVNNLPRVVKYPKKTESAPQYS